MYVRFRAQGRRLNVSLVESKWRRDRKPIAEHVASLGSVDLKVSVREHAAFWANLHERLSKLNARVDADTRAKICGAIHARIPMLTPDEQRALQR